MTGKSTTSCRFCALAQKESLCLDRWKASREGTGQCFVRRGMMIVTDERNEDKIDWPFQPYAVHGCPACGWEQMHLWAGTCKIGKCRLCGEQLHIVERDTDCPDGMMMVCDEQREKVRNFRV